MKSLLLTTVLLIQSLTLSAAEPIRVLIWDEQQPAQKQAYGEKFLGETIADHLSKQPGLAVTSVNINSPEQGLSAANLEKAEVIIWWGHVRHNDISDEAAERVVRRVMDQGIGFIPLHSAHWAKPFVRLMQERAKIDARAKIETDSGAANPLLTLTNQTPIGKGVKRDAPLTPFLTEIKPGEYRLTLPSCVFPAWRADGAPSHVTTLDPKHPIAAGLPANWDVNQTEMYNEPFHVPPPDAVIFEERWDKGEYFRSGCLWNIGKGRVFYFRPGHETFPVYKQAEPLRVLENAIRWLAKPSR